MKTLFVEKTFTYDGTQLRSLFNYLENGVLGDSIVSWCGPCEISFDHMVDGEDLLAQSPIRGSSMLHFIVERFVPDLFSAVALQRLLTSLGADLLRELLQTAKSPLANLIRRDGDDIYVDDRKFSISIATVCPVSSLIHFAVNIRNEGTPVPTVALTDFAIDAKSYALELMARFAYEKKTIDEATCKVRWVR